MSILTTKRIKILITLIGIFLAVIASIIIFSGQIDTSDKKDIEFRNRISEAYKEGNKKIKISTIFDGNWDVVCPVTSYDRVSYVASQSLRINQTDLVIMNTTDEVASDDVWGIVFLYPPNKAEYIKLTGYYYHSGGCLDKENAAIEILLAQPKNMIALTHLIEK